MSLRARQHGCGVSTLSQSLILFNFLLYINRAVTAPDPSNPLNIDWDPAPPPDKGPPLSRGASRDKSLLGAQVGAIVGSWILFLVLLAFFLIFVGRRLRADALKSRASPDVEMVKPVLQRNFEPSPISANPESAEPGDTSPAPNFSWPSPTKQSFSTFDERVIQEDKAQREQDMERLYAAVMDQEAGVSTTSVATDSKSQHQRKPSVPKIKSPGLFRGLRSPTSPKAWSGSPEKDKPRKGSRPESHSSMSSSAGRRKLSGVRGLPISGPIPTPTFSLHSGRAGNASDEEPLTPRYPPPTPPNESSWSPPPSRHRTPEAAASSLPKPLQVSIPRSRSPPTITGGTSKRTTPPSPSSPSYLPLRSLNAAVDSSSSIQRQPTPGSTTTINLGNASTTKLTILEHAVPRSKALEANGLATATTPAVPYSPYMPFTPITPISPGLVSKKERKAREKAGLDGSATTGRRKVVVEMARGDNELWDGGI